jgi:hypothetical protein
MPNIRIDDDVYRFLLALSSEMQVELGRRVSLNEAVKEALRRAGIAEVEEK